MVKYFNIYLQESINHLSSTSTFYRNIYNNNKKRLSIKKINLPTVFTLNFKLLD